MINRDEYLKKLISRKWNGLVKIVTGVRRCGKSYLIFNIFKKYLVDSGIDKSHIIEIQLDDDVFEELKDRKKLGEYIRSKIVDEEEYYILIDEIQLCDGFEMVLNGLLRKSNVDCYVTGSNSKFLSSDIITEFRGRGDEIRVHPLSYKEFYDSFDGDKHNAYQVYSTFGGMPALAKATSNESKISYLSQLVNEVYLLDIIERNDIKNDKKILGELLDILSSSVGSLTNPTKLEKTYKSVANLNINKATISRYLDYFIDSFLINKVQRYDIKGKKLLTGDAKYYVVDAGLRYALLGDKDTDAGHILENVVYLELIRRGYNVSVGKIQTTVKNDAGKAERKTIEVDFVATKPGGQVEYYQVAWAIMGNEDAMKREYGSLEQIKDNYPKYLLTMDYGNSEQNGIKRLNVLEWLLNMK